MYEGKEFEEAEFFYTCTGPREGCDEEHATMEHAMACLLQHQNEARKRDRVLDWTIVTLSSWDELL